MNKPKLPIEFDEFRLNDDPPAYNTYPERMQCQGWQQIGWDADHPLIPADMREKYKAFLAEKQK